jgi:hypothetical protein
VLFGWKLEDLNTVNQNIAGIDLVDNDEKIVVQVSATATKQKIESALSKDLSSYAGYKFKFISISKDADGLRNQTFTNPHNLVFIPSDDIYDISSLLNIILAMEVERQKEVKEFLEKELKIEPDSRNIVTNLASIINLLANEDWSIDYQSVETKSFEIEEKIEYNQLVSARTLIDDYKIHCSRIEKIYSDFDKLGVNKSLSILNGIRSEYIKINTTETPDKIFYLIIDKVVEKVKESSNYEPLPDEELDLCVQIIVVDAFIRCKIFKNPNENSYAHPR